jgi:exodeoxyribonuclease VII large subunit
MCIPENGMEILLHAAPTLYEARGDFQLIVRHLEPVGQMHDGE